MSIKLYTKIKNTNRNLEILNKKFAQLFNDLYTPYFSFPNSNLSKLDIDWDDVEITVKTKIEGYKKEDIQINVQNKKLEVVAKKSTKDINKYYYLDYAYLPSEVDITKAKATYIDGLLTITMPRVEKPKSETMIKVE